MTTTNQALSLLVNIGKRLPDLDQPSGNRAELSRARTVIAETADLLGKEDPWDEVLWEPVQVLGLESVGPDSVVIQVQAKTMPLNNAISAQRRVLTMTHRTTTS